ncbi:MAG: hypothetical protein NZ899_08760 [Thermoguttaceae bacterium]|nr:hypothetical protein [Thermoguttaceae bacterium]MDW8077964.1 hypothetical protein [Thermoguttaceae bacterium]
MLCGATSFDTTTKLPEGFSAGYPCGEGGIYEFSWQLFAVVAGAFYEQRYGWGVERSLVCHVGLFDRDRALRFSQG